MLNFPDTVLSQYSDSPALCSIIASFNAAVDPQYMLQQFYDQIWNLDTCIGVGLDSWGRKVGIGRTLSINTGEFFGFTGVVNSVQGTSGDSFNVGIFYSGTPTTTNFTLVDHSYRQLILAKAAANITNGSIPAQNYILMNILFPDRGNAYVVNSGNMTMVYHFTFPLYLFEVAIIANSGVMPVPAGVSATLTYPGTIN
jgi:hypothetical protein